MENKENVSINENLDNTEVQSEPVLNKKSEGKFEVAIWKKIYLFLMGLGGLYLISFIASLILLLLMNYLHIAPNHNFDKNILI